MASCLVDLYKQFVETLNDWTLTLNNGESVCVANIDFAKAFDSVCTSELLCKLQSFNPVN